MGWLALLCALGGPVLVVIAAYSTRKDKAFELTAEGTFDSCRYRVWVCVLAALVAPAALAWAVIDTRGVARDQDAARDLFAVYTTRMPGAPFRHPKLVSNGYGQVVECGVPRYEGNLDWFMAKRICLAMRMDERPGERVVAVWKVPRQGGWDWDGYDCRVTGALRGRYVEGELPVAGCE